MVWTKKRHSMICKRKKRLDEIKKGDKRAQKEI